MSQTGSFFTRPLTVMGHIISLHGLMYGIGYMIPSAGFGNTVLYNNVSSITEPFYFGFILFLVSILGFFAWGKDSGRLIEFTSFAQAIIWLFATFCYFFNGDIALGIGVGMAWSMLSGYLGFAYKIKERTVMYLANQQFMKILDGD